jgi:hypothetical protein
MADFPSVCPVRRTYTAAKYPTKRFTSISGAGTTRLYGSKAFDAKMSLEFMADDETIEQLLNNWHESYGAYLPITLPDSVYAGHDRLLDKITPRYLEWHWEREPTITSVQPNLSRVQVNLIAHLEI